MGNGKSILEDEDFHFKSLTYGIESIRKSGIRVAEEIARDVECSQTRDCANQTVEHVEKCTEDAVKVGAETASHIVRTFDHNLKNWGKEIYNKSWEKEY